MGKFTLFSRNSHIYKYILHKYLNNFHAYVCVEKTTEIKLQTFDIHKFSIWCYNEMKKKVMPNINVQTNFTYEWKRRYFNWKINKWYVSNFFMYYNEGQQKVCKRKQNYQIGSFNKMVAHLMAFLCVCMSMWVCECVYGSKSHIKRVNNTCVNDVLNVLMCR